MSNTLRDYKEKLIKANTSPEYACMCVESWIKSEKESFSKRKEKRVNREQLSILQSIQRAAGTFTLLSTLYLWESRENHTYTTAILMKVIIIDPNRLEYTLRFMVIEHYRSTISNLFEYKKIIHTYSFFFLLVLSCINGPRRIHNKIN